VWRATDIAVVPSTEPEPFGMVAIEAMACALPVVAAAHGGLLDIVQHDITGLQFEPCNAQALADALLRLATDPQLRQRLGQAGARRQATLFSLETQVQKTRELCQELVRQQ
jgi:glycosyltransferase involved in cell wall biosynthesis